jgi:hypothetical protein
MESQELVDTLLGSSVERFQRAHGLQMRRRRLLRASWIFLILLAFTVQAFWAQSMILSLSALRAATEMEPEHVPNIYGAVVPLVAIVVVGVAFLLEERRGLSQELLARSLALRSPDGAFELRALLDSKRRCLMLADETGHVVAELDISGAEPVWKTRSSRAS